MSAPNSIIENSLKVTNFLIQINDDRILGKITAIRLLQIQEELLLEKSILLEMPKL
jgi:hypothetical protein